MARDRPTRLDRTTEPNRTRKPSNRPNLPKLDRSNRTRKPSEPSESENVGKSKMSGNIRTGVHPRMSKTYTSAYVHAIHTHTVALSPWKSVLHTLIMIGSVFPYILWDPMLSYLCGISHSFGFPLSLSKLHTHITWYLFIHFMHSKMCREALEDIYLSISMHK